MIHIQAILWYTIKKGDAMNKRKVPKATMQRYPLYLKALKKLQSLGIDRIMSNQLGSFIDVEPTTIRRDFSFIGTLGKQGYGYDVETLIDTFEGHLGGTYNEKIIIVGAGNLGRALMNYNRWNNVVGEVACAFDIDESKVGVVNDIPVYPLSQIAKSIPVGCRIAILTVSHDAQETVDKLIEAGIVGIISFTHDHIRVPKDVFIKYVDVISSIQELVFQVNNI